MRLSSFLTCVAFSSCAGFSFHEGIYGATLFCVLMVVVNIADGVIKK